MVFIRLFCGVGAFIRINMVDYRPSASAAGMLVASAGFKCIRFLKWGKRHTNAHAMPGHGRKWLPGNHIFTSFVHS